MTSLITTLAGNPIVTVGLIYLLTSAPDQYRLPAIDFLHSKLKLSSLSIDRLVLGLKVLSGLAVVKTINRKLSAVAMTHWQWIAPTKNWHWNSEIAVVTGGSMGIGRGVVADLYSKGLRIAIFDVAEPPLEFQNKPRIMFCKCDLTSVESIKEAAEAVRAKFGNPSVVINNAGVSGRFTVLEIDPARLEAMFRINIMSHFCMTKEFLPDMLRKDKGHILATASMASFIGMPGVVPYSCTKAGVLALQEGLAGEIKHVHKKRGVMLSTVHPSWVATPMVAEFENSSGMKVEGAVTISTIGKIIGDHIYSCRGGQILVPNHASNKFGTLMRAMPNWMQEGFRDIAITNIESGSEGLIARQVKY